MLHKSDNAKLEMDPDSPLNRAHRIERQAERMLISGQYEQATSCYIQAAENLELAIQQTQNPGAVLSLRLQLENLRKQPLIIKKRQQWGKRKPDSVMTVWNGRFLNDDTPNVLKGPNSACEGACDKGAEQEVEEGRMRTESLESRFSSSEETDSLLALIRQHRDDEDERPGYRVSQLLAAIKTLSLRHQDGAKAVLHGDQNKQTEVATGCKIPNTQQMDVEKLRSQNRLLETQNQELREHLKQLFQVLDSCQHENQKLKETIADLTRQLEECRAHHVERTNEDHFGMVSDPTLGTPFSLIDGFAGTPPLESLPPLSALLIPDFEQFEDMS